MDDTVRIRQTIDIEGSPIRLYARISKAAAEHLEALFANEKGSMTNERRNQLIEEATTKYPVETK